MRLLIVTQYFWPENFRINDLVTEFIQRGHEITILTGKPNYPDGNIFKEFLEDHKKFSHYQGAEIIRVPLIPRGKNSLQLVLNYCSFALNATLIGVWRLRNKKFDAIFSPQLSPVTIAIPAIVIRKVKKLPLTLWVLDLWPDSLRATNAVKSTLVLKLIGKLVSLIYHHSDLILAQSRSFISQIETYSKRKNNIEYYPSWSESIFNLDNTQPAPELIKKPGIFNIIFAGNIGESQDFPAILAAAELLKEQQHIHWIILGDGRRSQWVADEIVRRKLEEHVFMLGRHPIERMPSFFKHADALLVSLKDEPIFGMTIPGKIQAYLASGIPIISMLNGEGAYVVKQSKAGLTCPAGDYHALASLAIQLSKTPIEERIKMGQNGLKFNELEFNRIRLINQLEYWLIHTHLKETQKIKR